MMIEDLYWTAAEEHISIFHKSRNNCNSFICLSLFERRVRPMFSKRSVNCLILTVTGNCSASLRVLASFLKVVSAMTGNPP